MRYPLVVAALLLARSADAKPMPSADHEIDPVLVRGSIAGPVATFTVRFLVMTSEPTFAESFASIELPPAGLVTGGTALRDGLITRLDLTPAALADDKFTALGADVAEPGEPRSAVLVKAGAAGAVILGIAAPHGGVTTVELTVTSPTCFYNDARYVSVPASWRKVVETSLRRPISNQVNDACAEHANGTEEWIGFPSTDLKRRPSGERIGAFAGRVALGEEHVVHAELDLSAVLTDIPRDLATVILVDGSLSMSRTELEAQRQIVASYLRAAPASRVQVIAYARRAKQLLPGWMSATLAAGRVDRELRALPQRNGSNFDAGLAEAALWLSRIEGTRRVILVTDERMADRLGELPPVTLRRLLPDGTLVHVVAVSGAPGAPVRDDTAKLSPLAEATDGMAVRVGAVTEPAQLDATLLVRPISLDHIAIKAPGWTKMSPAACDDDGNTLLPEGHSCAWWGEGEAASGPVVVEGLLWGKRVQRVLTPDLGHGREVARELSTFDSIEETLKLDAEAFARAVNSTWSLFASWGGTRHYTTGFGFGGGGSSSCCGDRIGTMSGSRGTGTVLERVDLEPQVRPLLAGCHVEADTVQITFEMTLVEIADLKVTLTPPDNTPTAVVRKQQACVEDALWDATLMLPQILDHEAYDVTLSPKG